VIMEFGRLVGRARESAAAVPDHYDLTAVRNRRTRGHVLVAPRSSRGVRRSAGRGGDTSGRGDQVVASRADRRAASARYARTAMAAASTAAPIAIQATSQAGMP
jgi:hypothetical protein